MDIHVGTSGFSFPSWRAQVYPHTLKSDRMFDYYCQRLGFDGVELNSSFYHMPSAKSLASLAKRSPEGFGFMVKVNQAFTHNRFEATPERFQQFLGALQPLADSGKLRGLLAQFPPDFLPTPEAAGWLRALRERFAPHSLFVEFRHRRWDAPKVIQQLRKDGLGYCITDLPRLTPLPTFVPAATTKTAYVRLHGRNPEWYRPSTGRYDYSYSDFELTGVIARLRSMNPSPGEAYVFFNNCYSGRAVRSAKRFQELLLRQRSLA
jgi:uncharacterized protein YecE (DUF72 family)